jgi:HSP20 family protein
LHHREKSDEEMGAMTIQQAPPEQLAERPETKRPGEATQKERWPLIEVFSEQGKLVVTADLPGVPAEDITVRISEQEIRLIGERQRGAEASDRQYFEQEPRYGHFERAIQLPKRVKPQTMTAHTEDGLLRLQVEVAAD